jgi:hypothetical protein
VVALADPCTVDPPARSGTTSGRRNPRSSTPRQSTAEKSPRGWLRIPTTRLIWQKPCRPCAGLQPAPGCHQFPAGRRGRLSAASFTPRQEHNPGWPQSLSPESPGEAPSLGIVVSSVPCARTSLSGNRDSPHLDAADRLPGGADKLDHLGLELRSERPTRERLVPSHGLHNGHPLRAFAPHRGCPSNRVRPSAFGAVRCKRCLYHNVQASVTRSEQRATQRRRRASLALDLLSLRKGGAEAKKAKKQRKLDAGNKDGKGSRATLTAARPRPLARTAQATAVGLGPSRRRPS